MDPLGPLAAAGLGLEAPDERAIAGLESAARDRLVGERRAGVVEDGTDIAEALGRVLSPAAFGSSVFMTVTRMF